MSIIPHHIQAQYARDVYESERRGITPEELRTERKQEKAALDQMRADNATVLKGVAKMAELGKTGWYCTIEFLRQTTIYCYHQTDPYHEKIRHRFDGGNLAECFAKLLEVFR